MKNGMGFITASEHRDAIAGPHFFHLPYALQLRIIELVIAEKDAFFDIKYVGRSICVSRAWKDLFMTALRSSRLLSNIILRASLPATAEPGVATLLSQICHMTVLNLQFCTQLVGDTFVHTLSSCAALESLCLDYCERIPPGALDTLFAHGPKKNDEFPFRLKHLSLASCPRAV